MAVYLIEYEICGAPYTGSTKSKFKSRANSQEYSDTVCEQRDSSKVHVNTEWFYEHYCSDRHNGIEDWVIMLIGSADTLKQLRSKELCRMHKVKTHVLTKGMFIKHFENSK